MANAETRPIRRYLVSVDETCWRPNDAASGGLDRVAALAVAIPEPWRHYRLPRAMLAAFDNGGPFTRGERMHGTACESPVRALTALATSLFATDPKDCPADPTAMEAVLGYHERSGDGPHPATHETLRTLQVQVFAACQAIRRLSRRAAEQRREARVILLMGELSFVTPAASDLLEEAVRDQLGDDAGVLERLLVAPAADPAIQLADLLLLHLRRHWPSTALPGDLPNAVTTMASQDTARYLPPAVVLRMLTGVRTPAFGRAGGTDGVEEAVVDYSARSGSPSDAVLELVEAVDRSLISVPERTAASLDRAINWLDRLDAARLATARHPSWQSASGFSATFGLLDARLRALNHAGRADEPTARDAFAALERLANTPPPDFTSIDMVMSRFARLAEHLRDRFGFDDGLRLVRAAETRYRPLVRYIERQFESACIRAMGTLASARARLLSAQAPCLDAPAAQQAYSEAEAALKEAGEWFADPRDEQRRQLNLCHLYVTMGRGRDALGAWRMAVQAPSQAQGDAGALAGWLATWLPPLRVQAEGVPDPFVVWALARVMACGATLPGERPGEQRKLADSASNWLLRVVAAQLAWNTGRLSHPWPSILRDTVAVARVVAPAWPDLAKVRERALRSAPHRAPLMHLETAAIRAEFGTAEADATVQQDAMNELAAVIDSMPHARRVFSFCLDPTQPLQARCEHLTSRFPRD